MYCSSHHVFFAGHVCVVSFEHSVIRLECRHPIQDFSSILFNAYSLCIRSNNIAHYGRCVLNMGHLDVLANNGGEKENCRCECSATESAICERGEAFGIKEEITVKPDQAMKRLSGAIQEP